VLEDSVKSGGGAKTAAELTSSSKISMFCVLPY
jgi:hypothetical protein